ncbi:hypothetical protein AB205_0114900 [Aquarana catesbeiana]|uniref:DNA replication ATP-dependent helicase/nuclease DNA2 n=1 Tax=Aquarana catesbeiana TaxID=8400 RepID=A0A2G9RRW8_AQUCT|nr:hypothetical protein AB205_0114900 [Aquarana catesbeiana]
MFASFNNGLQASDKGSRQMLIGTMLHDIFQKATTQGFGGDVLQKLALQTVHVPKYLKEMYQLNLSQADVMQEVGEYLPSFEKWARDSMIPTHQQEPQWISELLKIRNGLSFYLSNVVHKSNGSKEIKLSALPTMIADKQACKFCSQFRNCALYSRSVEQPSGSFYIPSEMAPIIENQTEHLKDSHLQYFNLWYLMCCLEGQSKESKNGRKNIWMLSAAEREDNGQCIGDLIRTGSVQPLAEGQYLHTFHRQSGNIPAINLATGDRVVVSGEDKKFLALSSGFIRDVNENNITCILDRSLAKIPQGTIFRLDHEEGGGGLDAHLGNLSKLMENSPGRRIAMRLKVLFFQSTTYAHRIQKSVPPSPQVRILYACGFSVLLTSYTHSAVDNILLKLKRFQVGFLRLGRTQKIHPEIQKFGEEEILQAKSIKTLSGLEELYNSQPVVGTTCMGVNHPIFTRRRFDFCIVDEASQISQPICLGPLFFADRFVLVGDHQQLPPLVQSAEARELGMSESLFKRLEKNQDAVVNLTVQYRMNSKIMSLSNKLVYEGRLECASERVSTATVQLPQLKSLKLELEIRETPETAWIKDVLEPSNPVVFLNTENVSFPKAGYTQAETVNLAGTRRLSAHVYSSLSDRSSLMTDEHVGKPASDQRLQPMVVPLSEYNSSAGK